MVFRMKNVTSFLLVLFFLNSIAVSARPYNFSATEKHIAYSDSSLILIPFEYKQSALYHAFTYEVIDSVVNKLLKNDAITLSINGYAHFDEGSDTICKYLSLNRALFVRDYILGRGIKENRLVVVQGLGATRSGNSNVNKDGHALNCRAELILNYPAPPPPPKIVDRDEDGIVDSADACADEFGYAANKGCPDKTAIIIPFETEQASLSASAYKILDSVVWALKQDPAFTINIQGHADKQEGIRQVCDRLGMERATLVKGYLLSRYIPLSRIFSVENFGATRPLNTGKNPKEKGLNARVQLFLLK